MRITLIVLLHICASICYGQDYYFKASGKQVSSIEEAGKYVELKEKKNKHTVKEYSVENGKKMELLAVKKVNQVSDSTIVIEKYINNRLLSRTTRFFKPINDSLYLVEDYYNNGDIRYQGECLSYLPLIKHGKSKRYYSNNKLRGEDIHKYNELIGNENWLKNGEKSVSNVFDQVENSQTFLDSMQKFKLYIQSNLIYPEVARRNNEEGIVYVEFIVTEKGKITATQILSGMTDVLNKEAIRVIEQFPDSWEPGKIEGRSVNVKLSLPVNFTLTD